MWSVAPVSDSFIALEECNPLTLLRTLYVITSQAAEKAEKHKLFQLFFPSCPDQFSAPMPGFS